MLQLFAVFTAFGLSFSAGLNAYIPLFIIGILAHYTELIKLSTPWDALANPWALIVLGVLIAVEFLADKIPAVNHINDAIQTFIRPTAGAVAFAATAGVIADLHPVVALVCGLFIAGSVHALKSAVVRPVVTATTGGAGNTPVSILEDVVASVLSFLSIILPILVVIFIILFIVLIIMWKNRRTQNAKTR